MLNFRTTIAEQTPAAAIFLTDEQVTQLSPAKTPPVVVRIGERSARLRVSRMGGPACIGLSKAARQQLGVAIGDEVDVTIELDQEERTVEVPADLADALDADPAARRAWEALAYSRRKELARGVAEAKQQATRERRLTKALAELHG